MKNVDEIRLWLMAAVWFAVAGATLFAIAAYATAPGRSEAAPSQWPIGLQNVIHPDPARSTLILFAHPLCPCTQASLWELETVARQLEGMIELHVLFFEPEDTAASPELWSASALKQQAADLPGTHLHSDVDGQIARHFGAYTSGQILLYSTDGKLQFSGGITPSRGHTGMNPGRAAIISAVVSDDGVDPLAPLSTPVFGCSIHGAEDDDRKSSDLSNAQSLSTEQLFPDINQNATQT